MNSQTNPGTDEAQNILEALRQIQENDELRSDAAKNPESVLNRLGLSGAARHAVAFGIAGLLIAPIATRPMGITGFWNG